MTHVSVPVLSVRDLTVRYGDVHAVNGVSFDVARGETLAIVGESGSGKTSTGQAILRLREPTSGHITYDGIDVRALGRSALRTWRRRVQLVFQDPYASLNPRMSVGAIVREGIEIHGLARGNAANDRVRSLLAEVGLDPAYAARYPHELSGGQRQRVGIARALGVEPEFIVCDEPVSALDVSVQAQVINLLQDLQRQRGLTYVFIAHDLAVVAHVATRVAVMYLGRIVELAPAAELYRSPIMPYTKALLAAVPVADPTAPKHRVVLGGDPPSPTNLPPGCVFFPRCPHPRKDIACTQINPPLAEKTPGHWAACIKEP
jgi:oligopeptide/dipeptide ABC transporter ATP-binding protein